jgi:hypothetical protein
MRSIIDKSQMKVYTTMILAGDAEFDNPYGTGKQTEEEISINLQKRTEHGKTF